MYVHIGGDVSVPAAKITAVLSLETALPQQKDITNFINAEDDSNRLQYLTDEIPKTLVVTDDKTYVSSISSSVLLKRLKNAETY